MAKEAASEAGNFAATRGLLQKWIGEDGIEPEEIDGYAKLVEGGKCLVSEYAREKRFLAALAKDGETEVVCHESNNNNLGNECKRTPSKQNAKMSDAIHQALVPPRNQRHSKVRVERLDLDGFLDFTPRAEVMESEEWMTRWKSRRKWNYYHGSFVMELIVDTTLTPDELLSSSNVLRAIIELKWLNMGQLAWFRFGLTWLGALSFTAFSGLRQYTEYDDYKWLMGSCVALSLLQIVVMLALIWWMSGRKMDWFLKTEGVAAITIPIILWTIVALATVQGLWLLNCLLSLFLYVEVKETWVRNKVSLLHDPWCLVKNDPLGLFLDVAGPCRALLSLLMVTILLAGWAEPDAVFGSMSILTFLFWLQMAKELRGRRVFGVYISLIHGVLTSTLPFLLLVGLGVMALTFAWWVLSMQRPDSHYLQEEASVHCVETPTGLICGTLPQSHDSMLTRLWNSFTFSYRAALLGDYPGDAFALADYMGEDSSPKLATAFPAWVFFFCATYVNLIVLLNLLIAIMNSRFEDLMNRAYAVSLRQRAKVCVEFERTVQSSLTTETEEDRRMVFSYTLDQQQTKASGGGEAEAAAAAAAAAAPPLSSELLEQSIERKLAPLASRLAGLEGLVATSLQDVQKSIAALDRKVEALSASREPRRGGSTPL